MVDDRKEPTISAIKPERDEIASHQDRLGKKPTQSGPAHSSAAAPSRPAPVKAKTSATAVFAFLLALVGIAAGSYAVWQLQLSNQQLASAGERIAELEARLNLTNTESDQSVSAIHEKLEWADSEIRKLWGVSYDTNRKAIAANKDQLASVGNTAQSAAAAAKKANELASQQQNTLSSLRTQTSEQELVLTRANEEIDQLQQRLREVGDVASRLENEVNQLENSLSNRVASNEEAIKAIDAFRRSANSDIQQLKDQVSGVGGGQ